MDCDAASYKQARYEESSNEMKSMLVNAEEDVQKAYDNFMEDSNAWRTRAKMSVFSPPLSC